MADSPDGDLSWVRDDPPVWDADKARVIGAAPTGAFVLTAQAGDQLPGEWWSARDSEGTVVGYGRLDTTWGGDAEILLAVAPDRQEQGIGTFILQKLDDEAGARGINYIHNRIRDHAQRDFVHDWLVVRGFSGPAEGDLRKRVGGRYSRSRRIPSAAEPYDAAQDPAGQPPGREEQGGYVNIDEHQY